MGGARGVHETGVAPCRGGAPYLLGSSRVNYSLLVMESAGMMKMATSKGSPLRQGAGKGSREVFGGYRGLRRRNSRSIFSVDVLGYV